MSKETLGTSTYPNFDEFVGANPLVSAARDFAGHAHEGQTRKNGEPYISHPHAVAKIFYEEWRIRDEKIIAAAYLHDVPEDTGVTIDEIAVRFGQKVARMVEGVSKFQSENKEEIDLKTLKKVVEIGYVDYEVSLLKLADRLHNLRTMGDMPKEKQISKSQETIDVYAKLAQSLGMWEVRRELQETAFFYTDPKGYSEIQKDLKKDERLRKNFIDNTKSLLKEIITRHGGDAKIETQINSFLRLKEKKQKIPSFLKINDVISFRIVVSEKETEAETIFECYRLLGILRNDPRFNALEDVERFDDFIAFPRDNGYKAIQMTLDYAGRGTVEFAIAGAKQEEFNRSGILSRLWRGERDLSEYLLKLVFTPKKEIRFLQQDATGIDFAASISDSLLAEAVAVKVNGKEVSLSTVLPNGADVEIVPGGERIAPNPEFLNYALPGTRRKILEQLEAQAVEELKIKGKEMIKEILAPRGLLNIEDVEEKVRGLLHFLGCEGEAQKLYFKVGTGALSEDLLSSELDRVGITKENLGLTTVYIEGEDKPGILKDLSTWLADLGGNIKASKHRGVEKRFSLRLVVEGLSNSQEQNLAQKLEEDGRFEISRVV